MPVKTFFFYSQTRAGAKTPALAPASGQAMSLIHNIDTIISKSIISRVLDIIRRALLSTQSTVPLMRVGALPVTRTCPIPSLNLWSVTEEYKQEKSSSRGVSQG